MGGGVEERRRKKKKRQGWWDGGAVCMPGQIMLIKLEALFRTSHQRYLFHSGPTGLKESGAQKGRWLSFHQAADWSVEASAMLATVVQFLDYLQAEQVRRNVSTALSSGEI